MEADSFYIRMKKLITVMRLWRQTLDAKCYFEANQKSS